MPELGDVEGFRRVAQEAKGSRIERVEVADAGVVRNVSARQLGAALRGRRIGDAERIGKWLIVHTDGPALVVHFGMTGSLRHAGAEEDRHPHDRVVFVTDHGELRYRDMRKLRGIFLAHADDEIRAIIGRVGPDALHISAADLRRRLETSRSTIKSALMDQTRVAGIGNLLSDEILWRARIHPAVTTRALTDEQWASLHRSMRTVLRAVARAGHTPSGPRWLTGVRANKTAACPVCGGPLARTVINNRTSVWCPRCQRR